MWHVTTSTRGRVRSATVRSSGRQCGHDGRVVRRRVRVDLRAREVLPHASGAGESPPSFVLTQLAGAADCTLTYEGGVQHTDSGNFVFVTVADASVEAVVEATAGLRVVADVQQIRGSETGGVLRLQLTEPFLATALADHGAVLQRATATPSDTTLTIDISGGVETRHVTQFVQERFADVELRSKQTREQASEHGFYASVLDSLTERQLEVLETAYYGGFFESPRQATGETVADSLEISPQAFYQHIRTAQRKLFGGLIDDHAPLPPQHTD